MHEIELKFQVAAVARAAVDSAVAGRTPRPREHLQAAYFDTADRALAAAGLALRVRHEGRRWVQTLKGPGGDGMTRAEHNVPLAPPAGVVPLADPALHADTPVGARLRAVLKDAAPDNALGGVFHTDIRRRSRSLRTPRGAVEIAFDAGVILAAERRLPVCELEIELLSGSASAVIDAARRWVAQHGVWLDTRSKAERGDLLSRGETVAAVRKAQPVALSDDMPAPRAMRRVLASCCEQISVNASQVASGEYLAEHVHQLRVGLRRLRTALRLFKGIADTAALDDAATSLFRCLGGARDEAAVGRPLEEALGQALADVGLSLPTPHWQPPPDEQGAPPADASVRDAATQTLLLDLLACTREPDPPPTASDPEPAARELIERRLKRWHRQVVADAKRFAELDDAGRHALRRRAKRLRYALEFANDLYEPGVVKRYQKRLRQTLQRLGEVIDVMVGLQGYRALADSEPGVLFALGWLAQRRDRLVAQCEPELKAFVRVKPFWKG